MAAIERWRVNGIGRRCEVLASVLGILALACSGLLRRGIRVVEMVVGVSVPLNCEFLRLFYRDRD